MVKGKTIYKYFRLKVEEYLRTASFKSYLLVVMKKRVYQEIMLLRKDQYNQCTVRFHICNN